MAATATSSVPQVAASGMAPLPDVRVLCAIGLSGQLGLRGGLPWEGDRRPEFKADVARFFETDAGERA